MKKEKNKHVSRSITIYVNGNKCNLNCSYCYVVNSRCDEKTEKVDLKFDLHTMIEAFSVERLGGIADIVVIGSAETLLMEHIIPFVHGLLKHGHVVTVVTNATLTKRIKQLVDIDKIYLKRLIVKASLHYLELKRRGLLEVYYENIKYIVAAGASCYPFVIISEEYLPYLDEISSNCIDELGIKPQCSPCNEVVDAYSIKYSTKFKPEITYELYKKIDRQFDTRIFNEIVKNKRFDPQEHFCYAGLWSFGVDYATGSMSKCHGLPISVNFYEGDFCEKIKEPVACSCGIESCCLQYNFFAEGLLPDYDSGMLYGDMIYTKGFVSEDVRELLNVRFDHFYKRLSKEDELKFIIDNKNCQIREVMREKSRNPFFKEIIYRKKRKGAKIYIYGSGQMYEKYKDTIGFEFEAFLDTFVSDEKEVDGKSVWNINDFQMDGDFFIVIAIDNKEEIVTILENRGFVKGEQFI